MLEINIPVQARFMPFMSFFIATITPANEMGSAKNGSIKVGPDIKFDNSLNPLISNNNHKPTRHGAATAKISPVMASLLVFLLSGIILSPLLCLKNRSVQESALKHNKYNINNCTFNNRHFQAKQKGLQFPANPYWWEEVDSNHAKTP